MSRPARVYLGLGSNLGDRRQHLLSAFDRLDRLPGTRLVARSGLWETEPVGPVAQGRFLNAAGTIDTELAPRELLSALHAIEHEQGRDRSAETRWGPRTLDIDILLFADVVMHEPGLTLPHPRLHERMFVLEPLAELAPELVVPTIRRTVRQLLESLRKTHSGASP